MGWGGCLVPGIYLRPELLKNEEEFDEIAGPRSGEVGGDGLAELCPPDLLKFADIRVAELHAAQRKQ